MSRCYHCGGTHSNEAHFCPVTSQPVDLGPRLVGLVLFGTYRVVTVLGDGPIGIVLEVEDLKSGDRYAAKLIHPRFTAGNPNAGNQVLTDAAAASQLDNPFIAKIIRVGRDTGAALAVVRELMVGECLERRLDRVPRPPIRAAVKITRETLAALQALHDIGLVDLDLSPADIFLCRTAVGESVKLVDIGEHHIKAELAFTRRDELESADYYAPEQLIRGAPVDHRADVFAAAAVFYHIATGEIPSSPAKRIETLRSDIGTQLANVVHMALSPNPADRPQTAADFSAALEASSLELFEPGRVSLSPSWPPGVSSPPAAVSHATGEKERPHVSEEAEADELSSSEIEEVSEEVKATKKPLPGRPPDSLALSAEGYIRPAQPERQEELAQPSVIVDMPELARRMPLLHSKTFRAVLAIVVLLAAGGAFAAYVFQPDKSPLVADAATRIAITILVEPQDAAVLVDGRPVQGAPPRLETAADDKLHTIKAQAAGYEPIERDLAFDRTQTITLKLAQSKSPPKLPVVPDASAGQQNKEVEAAPTAASSAAAENPPSTQANAAKDATETRSTTSASRPSAKVGNEPAKATYRRGGKGSGRGKGSSAEEGGKPAKPPQKIEKTRDGFSKENPFG